MSRRLVVLLALVICLFAVCAAPASAWAPGPIAFTGQPPTVGAGPSSIAAADFLLCR